MLPNCRRRMMSDRNSIIRSIQGPFYACNVYSGLGLGLIGYNYTKNKISAIIYSSQEYSLLMILNNYNPSTVQLRALTGNI